jgi:DNA polymerase-3 subunit delta
MNLKKKNKYLVSGTKYFLDTNTENILKEMSNPEVNNYFGDEFNKEDFFSFIFTPSLFYDSKIAIIKNSEKIKDINDIVNQSSKSIESTIVFLFNEYDLKKIKLENKEQFEIYLEKKITKYNAAKEIVNLFKEKGFSIKQITAEDIYALCLQDINIVKKELEKIEIYYYNQNKPENDKDILDIISFSKNESIFTFIDSFSERKKRLSTYSLDNIISCVCTMSKFTK